VNNISKKLFVALALIVCGTALAWHGTITGDKWNEIFPGADFMVRPGLLAPEVSEHLLVLSDERDTCRRRSPFRVSLTILSSTFSLSDILLKILG